MQIATDMIMIHVEVVISWTLTPEKFFLNISDIIGGNEQQKYEDI